MVLNGDTTCCAFDMASQGSNYRQWAKSLDGQHGGSHDALSKPIQNFAISMRVDTTQAAVRSVVCKLRLGDVEELDIPSS